MSKKDYEKLAEALQRAKPSRPSPGSMRVWEDAVDEIAAVLAADNPRFDRVRFRAAAGVVEYR